MRTAEAYADLLNLDRKVITTDEARARWRTGNRTTNLRLKTLERAGLILHLRRGLWSLEPNLDPFVLPPYLTAPLPAYVSFWSALARHGMIEQLPRQVWVASLARPRKVTTALGGYEIHQIAAELFTGFGGSDKHGYLATPEKALFDTVYVRAAATTRAYFPELSLPRDFSRARINAWAKLIESPRLRTVVSRRLRQALKQAGSEDTG